jgi:WD40-like Beta Propeller Repeat
MALIGADASLPIGGGASAILSPDGTTLAFVAQPVGQAGPARIFVRQLDQLQAAALAGTEGANNPFFSPDGQWLAFFVVGTLKKVSVTGGATVTLCDATNGRGGTWTDDDTILFMPSGSPDIPLHRVSAAGGTPAAFGALSPGATTQRWPQALPGGQAVLFTEHSTAVNWDAANLVVAPLSGLPAHVALTSGTRLGVYQARSQALASLNHPHIAAIYGLEESGPAISRQYGQGSHATEYPHRPQLDRRTETPGAGEAGAQRASRPMPLVDQPSHR